MSAPIAFASAYRQLRPAEKAYVDAYVADVERKADRINERVSNALYRSIPADVVEASRGMLDKPMVLAAITERINSIAADRELSPQRVIKEVSSIAFANIMDFMTIDGNGLPTFDIASATPEQLAAVKKIEVEENMRGGRKFKFELHPKLEALGKLMQFMGMLDADNPVWPADTARPVAPALAADVTVDGAADAYARVING